ncbi:response regulator [candidate division CSSED10-310 bacterium]|uniref:Response regulator n=1 Tax=candidate division CSSED10-310 bacterium TaxID=2855610 RepID=A0ABV6YSS1_UNCC1
MASEVRKILVIDDSPTTRFLIASVIEQIEGVQIVEAESGFEALKILPSSHFDLVLTDINMPDINGLEVLNFLKNHPNYKNIPVIIISTEKAKKDRRKGLRLGAEEYITKPFDAKALFQIVERILVKA